MKSFLQSQSWAEFQISLGREVFEYNKEGIRALVIRMPTRFGKSYLYIPYGPEMDFNLMTGGIKNPVSKFIEWLKGVARENGAIFVKAEPMQDNITEAIISGGFERSRKPIEPHKTVVIDLDSASDQLLAGMHHKTRYNIKVADKHGIKVESSDNLDPFWDLMEKTTKRDKFYSQPREYYEKFFQRYKETKEAKIQIWYAKHEGKEISVATVLRSGDTAYYLHGASDHEYRSMMAPYALHWKIIRDLKARKVKKYDMWGIDAKRWPGVTRFKLGWGGRVVEYPGAFDLTVSGFWHLVYKMGRKILGK
ncbi:MAG: peptidoglycan bridge formation glycyltransferase FemA/FemB family protein [Parcubacteria group bacterium]